MPVGKIILIGLAAVFILATVLPFIRLDPWWIRAFDFPRGQIAVGGILLLIAYLFFWDVRSWLETGVLVLLALAVVYQGVRMFPYTPVAPRQVKAAEHVTPDRSFSILIANVLQENHESAAFLDVVAQYDPDLILTVETDHWWEEQLRALENDYPYTIKHPLGNTYGMLLHSRLELIDPELKYLVKDSIPSMHARVKLPSGDLVWLHCLHPEPPNPKWADATTERDAEVLLVGKEVKQRDEPTVVAGDFNDVAWSYTTDLFQEISGLLDPRRGRGMYNSFNAKNVLMRWPLDHVFHSDHLTLVRLERGPAWGSDHFPIFIALSLEPGAQDEQDEPEADAADEQEAEEKIDKAREKQQEPDE